MATLNALTPTRIQADKRTAYRFQATLEGVGVDDLVPLTELPQLCTMTELRIIVTDDNGGAVTRVDPQFFATDDDTPANMDNTVNDLGSASWVGTPGLNFEAGDTKRMALSGGQLYLHLQPDDAGGNIYLSCTVLEGHHV